jgi:hypothetical protein
VGVGRVLQREASPRTWGDDDDSSWEIATERATDARSNCLFPDLADIRDMASGRPTWVGRAWTWLATSRLGPRAKSCGADDGKRLYPRSGTAPSCGRDSGWPLSDSWLGALCRELPFPPYLVVVAADGRHSPDQVRSQLKTWSTRRLKTNAKVRLRLRGQDHAAPRQKGWAERGSDRFINHEDEPEAVIRFVLEAQDRDQRR